jgi:hypothetical protein
VPIVATALCAAAAVGLVALGARSRGAPNPRPVAMGADGLPAEIPKPGSPLPTAAEWDAAPRPIRTFGEAPLACDARMVREWLRVRCAAKGALDPKAVATTTPNGHEEHVGMHDGVATFVVRVVRGTAWRGRVVYATQRVPEMFAVLAEWPARDARPAVGYVDEPIME